MQFEMSTKKKLCFVLLKCCFVLVCNAQADYFNSKSWSNDDHLDPHSFYYDKHAQKEALPPGDNDSHEVGEYKGGDTSACCKQLHKCKAGQNTDVGDELLSRRLVNILISRANFKKDGSYSSGRIDLKATASELEALKNFGLGKLTLREIDPILNKVVQTPAFDPIHESTMWIHTAGLFLWNLLLQNKVIVIGTVAVLYLYYALRGTRFNFWIVLTATLQLILVVSFFITWWKLIQEAEIKHAAAQMQNMELPIQCQPHKMGWMDTIKSYFKSDDCEKYVAATMRQPMFQVTPAQALSHMLANVMYEPVAVAGQAVARFLRNLTEHMPVWLSAIVHFCLCLGFFPVIVLFIILLLGGTLNLGFGPFTMFSLRGHRSSAPRQSESLESKKERQPIEVILNITTNNAPQLPDLEVAPARSNNLAITACPECSERDQKKESSPKKAITHDVKAGGDSESMIEPGSPKETDDAESESGVRQRKTADLGGGDH